MSTSLDLPGDPELPAVGAYLEARLAHAEAVLERLAIDPEGPGGLARLAAATAAVRQAAKAAASARVVLPDERVARRFGLDAIDLDVLWLVAAPAIDPSLVVSLRRIEGGAGRDGFDAGLVARGLGADRAGRLAALATLEADAPLRRSGLIRAAPGERAHGRDLAAASWLPGYLRGARALGARLDGTCSLITPSIADRDVPLPERAGELVPLLRGFYETPREVVPGFAAEGLDHPRGIAVLIHGSPGSGRTVLSRATAGKLGRRVLQIDAAKLRQAPFVIAAEILDLACAEAAAFDELVVVRSAHDVIASAVALAVPMARAIAANPVAVVLIGLDNGTVASEMEQVLVWRHPHEMKPTSVDPAHLWLTNLPPDVELAAGLDIDNFARSIHLTPAQVRGAARVAILAGAGKGPLGEAELGAAARSQLEVGLGNLAEVQEATLRMSDIVLPQEQLDQVEEVIAAARNRDLVLRRWGLRRTIKRGLSISCLFDGDPGTGKTLAAEVIASELGLQLLRINVASIVDKFIGETEKNLTKIFEQARPDTTLLLFDEADSLFSKRTEVTHAVDRYSNMDVNVLLQLIERFEGTAVLTTNLKRGIDTAFERRIMFKVRFERPEAEQRKKIWELMLPRGVPSEETIDYDKLARLELSGGEIKNAVLRAAYSAARHGGLLRMRHLAEAAAHEAASTGRVYFDVSGHG
jgi:ATP-dependent 26S proteasome regulatory subunit